MQDKNPTNELFISVCLPLEHFESLSKKFISSLCSLLNNKFSFWEFLIVINEAEINLDQLNHILKLSRNIRFIRLKPNIPYYNQRFVAAKESLGDIVLIFSYDEVSPDDILKILEQSISSRKIVTAVTDRPFYLFNWALRLIGRNVGLQIDGSIARTMAFPRTYLNKILDNPDRIIALRYLPTANSFPVNIYHLSNIKNKLKKSKSLSSKIPLVRKLLVLLAPKFLMWISIIFSISMLISLLFAVYAVIIYIVSDKVQPGWFSTSLLISSSTFFISGGLFGISIGIQRLIDILTREDEGDILEEYASSNLFQSAFEKLNVFSPLDDENSDKISNDCK